MRLYILFAVLLVGAMLVDASRSSKRKKNKSRESTAEVDEDMAASRRSKDEDDNRDQEHRDRERERSEKGKKEREDSSSEEEEDDKKGKNATAVDDGKLKLHRVRRTQTVDKVQEKYKEETRARRYERANRKVAIRRRFVPYYTQRHALRSMRRERRHETSRATELNDGKQRPLSEEAKQTLAKMGHSERHRREPRYMDKQSMRRDRRHETSRATELNDGKQRPLSEEAKQTLAKVGHSERSRRELRLTDKYVVLDKHGHARTHPMSPRYTHHGNHLETEQESAARIDDELGPLRYLRFGYAARNMNKDYKPHH